MNHAPTHTSVLAAHLCGLYLLLHLARRELRSSLYMLRPVSPVGWTTDRVRMCQSWLCPLLERLNPLWVILCRGFTLSAASCRAGLAGHGQFPGSRRFLIMAKSTLKRKRASSSATESPRTVAVPTIDAPETVSSEAGRASESYALASQAVSASEMLDELSADEKALCMPQ